MATTWIKALHKSGGISAALSRSLDYISDGSKTNDGELIEGFECNPNTAQSEFLLSKKMYEQITGRNQGKNDVIAYHIRMSFKQDEVTAEKALALGMELGLRWTKGTHQFIVAAHTNTNNPHVHIIYNSVNLDCDRKFQDFKRSAIALRRISDKLCLENGLSIIEKPGLSKGHNRNEYLDITKPPTVRDQLREIMDAALVNCKDYDDFLSNLQATGVEIKRRKQLAFRLPNGKKFSRQDTLGDDYSSEAIHERILGKRIVTPKEKTAEQHTIMPREKSTPLIPKPNLLINIETKIKLGYSQGFEHWALLVNLKEAARTLLFLQERGLASYDLLTDKTNEVTKDFNARSSRIKEIETRQKEISELQKNIGTYIKTKDILAEYNKLKHIKPSTFSKLTNAQSPAEKFYAENEPAIIRCNAAKKYFDEHGYGRQSDKKLPSIKSLQIEYATLDSERKKLWLGYKIQRQEMIDLKLAKQNVDYILGEPKQPTKNHERDVR